MEQIRQHIEISSQLFISHNRTHFIVKHFQNCEKYKHGMFWIFWMFRLQEIINTKINYSRWKYSMWDNEAFNANKLLMGTSGYVYAIGCFRTWAIPSKSWRRFGAKQQYVIKCINWSVQCMLVKENLGCCHTHFSSIFITFFEIAYKYLFL